MKRTFAILFFSLATLAAVAVVSTFTFKKEDRWAQVDAFKASLPTKLAESDSSPVSFNIEELGNQLGAFRIEGMAVCAPEEIAADQYIRLSEIAQKFSAYKSVTIQIKNLLDQPTSITDCQFRVLDIAAK
jgi:hypothetical protein